MSKDDLLKKLWDIGHNIVETKGFELIDVEFVKESGNWYLRYYIDKPGGVNLDDCQLISVEVSRLLDVTDPIPYSYILEVSSPGLTRPLKRDIDFQRCLGQKVVVKTYAPLDGRKTVEGVLEYFDQDNLVLQEDKGKVVIPRINVSLVHRAIEF